jgi:hypothetical protein
MRLSFLTIHGGQLIHLQGVMTDVQQIAQIMLITLLPTYFVYFHLVSTSADTRSQKIREEHFRAKRMDNKSMLRLVLQSLFMNFDRSANNTRPSTLLYI